MFLTSSSSAVLVKTSRNSFLHTNNITGKERKIELNDFGGDIKYLAFTRHNNQALSGLDIYVMSSTNGYNYIIYEDTIISFSEEELNNLVSLPPQATIGVFQLFNKNTFYFIGSPQALPSVLRASRPREMTCLACGSQLQKASESTFTIMPNNVREANPLLCLSGTLQILEEMEF